MIYLSTDSASQVLTQAEENSVRLPPLGFTLPWVLGRLEVSGSAPGVLWREWHPERTAGAISPQTGRNSVPGFA